MADPLWSSIITSNAQEGYNNSDDFITTALHRPKPESTLDTNGPGNLSPSVLPSDHDTPSILHRICSCLS